MAKRTTSSPHALPVNQDTRLIPQTVGWLCVLLMLPSILWAQARTDTTTVEDDIESVLDAADVPDEAVAQLVEVLEDLAAHPLDVNTARVDQLALVPALGAVLAQLIVDYRTEYGPFRSLSQLRRVPGLDEAEYAAARPYLTIAPGTGARATGSRRYPERFSLRDVARGLRFEMIQRAGRRLEVGKGYRDDSSHTSYAGSPDRIYARLRLRARGRFSANVTMEKDPGESFGWQTDRAVYGFDHLTMHVALQDYGRLKTLVVGDYVAAFGQGLVLWRSTGFGKGRNPVRPLVRLGRGIVPYGSTDENRFFRGAAATVRLAPSLSLTGFASRRSLDATLSPRALIGGTESPRAAEGLSLSGLHRTPTEMSKKDALSERVVGGALEWERGHLRLGAAGYHTAFDQPFAPSVQPYHEYRFVGRTTSMGGISGSLLVGQAHVFGEAAVAGNGATAGVGGVTFQVARTAEVLVLARHYPADFNSLHGYAFGERNGATQNETGFYLGLTIRPSTSWRIAGYFDQFRFPWLRFGVPRPSAGYEGLVSVEYAPRRWASFHVQARSERKEAGTVITDDAGRRLDGLREETRQSLRLDGDYAFSRSLRVRARIEGVRFVAEASDPEVGVVLYNDLRWMARPSLQFDLRFAYFDTESYDARVFTYENDLLYTFSVPSFSGRGQRAYLLARWRPTRSLSLQVKYAVTRYENVRTVGSGLDEVAGNRLRDIRAQVRWRL